MASKASVQRISGGGAGTAATDNSEPLNDTMESTAEQEHNLATVPSAPAGMSVVSTGDGAGDSGSALLSAQQTLQINYTNRDRGSGSSETNHATATTSQTLPVPTTMAPPVPSLSHPTPDAPTLSSVEIPSANPEIPLVTEPDVLIPPNMAATAPKPTTPPPVAEPPTISVNTTPNAPISSSNAMYTVPSVTPSTTNPSALRTSPTLPSNHQHDTHPLPSGSLMSTPAPVTTGLDTGGSSSPQIDRKGKGRALPTATLDDDATDQDELASGTEEAQQTSIAAPKSTKRQRATPGSSTPKTKKIRTAKGTSSKPRTAKGTSSKNVGRSESRKKSGGRSVNKDNVMDVDEGEREFFKEMNGEISEPDDGDWRM
ncbi:hypothetical protein HDU93_004767, partial [Gonapodya sp. JEL0774]